MNTIPAHDCGMCNAPIRFDGMAGPYRTWRCTECNWWHISKDCCDTIYDYEQEPLL